MSANDETPIVFPDRDRDKSYIGKFSEVICQVMMKTSDESTVTIDLENLGQIEVKPWSSDENDPHPFVQTYEDRTVFSPVNGHDVMVLQLMAEHATKFKQVVDAELATAESAGQSQSVKVAG